MRKGRTSKNINKDKVLVFILAFILIFIVIAFKNVIYKNIKVSTNTVKVDADIKKEQYKKDEEAKNKQKDEEKKEETKEQAKDNTPKVKMVPFKGKVEHIFFHPLIAYPEQAFDGDNKAEDFDDWFITVSEFNKIVESLYSKNFILVDINSLYEETEQNGRKILQRKEIMIPEGKKPLIISVDDLNYYKYMIGDGTVHKLMLDDNGDIVTYSINSKGGKVIAKDNEIIPILDEFIKVHPDFSLNGAKGTIALTGYEGILGYRTDFDSKNYEKEREEAAKVVKRLKETGWNFASHSYGHHNHNSITIEKLKKDNNKWKKEVESLIGKTQVYIFPFGEGPKYSESKFKYLQDEGFKIFCYVGQSSYENILKDMDAVVTDRRHVDGISLRHQKKGFLDLYDSDEVIDLKVRPKR